MDDNIDVLDSKKEMLKKLIFKIEDKEAYYAVVFYYAKIDALILCVSSQIGCNENCLFCATGNQKFIKNLSQEQIVNEINKSLFYMKDYLDVKQPNTLHLIFEGMGEPSHNTCNCFNAFLDVYPVLSSIFSKIILRISSAGNITLVNKYIKFVDSNKFLKEKVDFQVKLSLHTPFDEERILLVPSISKNHNIKDILHNYYLLSDYLSNKLLCNYVLFSYPNGGNNYSENHLHEIVKILDAKKTKILLGYYSETNRGFISPNTHIYKNVIEFFERNNIETEIINLKGKDINAACGMLQYK